jgi:hypothetical protein
MPFQSRHLRISKTFHHHRHHHFPNKQLGRKKLVLQLKKGGRLASRRQPFSTPYRREIKLIQPIKLNLIPAETTAIAANGPSLELNRTFTVRRKVAKRSESWYHEPPKQNIAVPLPPSPETELFPVRKKQRLEKPLPTTIDENARRTASPDVSAGLPPAAAENNDDTNTDPVRNRMLVKLGPLVVGRRKKIQS